MLGMRRGLMQEMHDAGQGMTRMVYIAPTRGLLGFRYQFLTSTRGAGVMHTIFHGYDEMSGPMSTRQTGSLVAWEAGETTAYALKNAEERGTLFLGPGVSIYEGMVVGENSRGADMPINVCKKKHLTNIRSAGADMEIRLTPPRRMTTRPGRTSWMAMRLSSPGLGRQSATGPGFGLAATSHPSLPQD